MEMKNKLHYTRIKWFSYIRDLDYELDEFLDSRYFKNKKIRSMDRKAYYFLLNKYGRYWIKTFRDFWNKKHRFITDEDIKRIASIPWIKLPEED